MSLITIMDSQFNVLATSGNTSLGGEDFNERMINYFIERFKKKTGKLVDEAKARRRLKKEVERTKRSLSFILQETIILDGYNDGEDYIDSISRAKFEEINMVRMGFIQCLESVATQPCINALHSTVAVYYPASMRKG